MCGIFGMISPAGAPLRHRHLAGRMSELLAHRGPDGCGTFARSSVLLGARRLGIIDPEPRGDQPMSDSEQRLWLVCNGEIYNAPELRRRVPNYPFRSQSDVEVILPLYRELGPSAVQLLHGMFALALWDEVTRTLLLARDRAGEKPLFYTCVGGELWFASEIQALLVNPDLARRLDLAALTQVVTQGYVAEPHTMFQAVRSLEAGAVLCVGPKGMQGRRYWDGAPGPHQNGRVPALEDELRHRLARAVRRQTRADVPVGVFTSGGVDSSLVAALAADALSPRPLHTFTVAFAAPSYDESRFAIRLAKHLGATPVTVPVEEDGLADALETLTSRLAEPVTDPAVLPTILLARAAREHVKVVLSGEGADELFGGYPTYLGHALAPWFQRLPHSARALLRGIAQALPPSERRVPLRWLLQAFVREAERPWLARHRLWTSTGLDAGAVFAQAGLERSADSPASQPHLPPLVPVWSPPLSEEAALRGAMLLDFHTALRQQLLVKLDRATMLAGLEARAPYLDPDVVDFALALHPQYKIRTGQTKWLLKRAARPWVPARHVRRRKRGLSVPVAAWLNRGLRDEVDRLLARDRLRQQGLFSDVYVHRLLAAHRSGRANHARPLWTLVVLQRWLETWVPEVA